MSSNLIGPQLPRGNASRSSRVSPKKGVAIGPELPVDDNEPEVDFPLSVPEVSHSGSGNGQSDPDVYGPALPPGLEHVHTEDECDEAECSNIGPLPETVSSFNEYELESRRERLRLVEAAKALAPAKREEWMVELPPTLQHIGLGPRKFKQGYSANAEDEPDRSVWTETPSDCVQRQLAGGSDTSSSKIAEKACSKRDKELDNVVADMNRERGSVSLLDSLKRKSDVSQEEDGKRRPFNRDEDLALNVMSAKERTSFIARAHSLNSRFQHGVQKYS